MRQLSLKKVKLADEQNFRKNFIWNMLGMTFNSFNSLFYMVIVTRINGTDEAGIFTLAFSVACLVFYIGTYAGRVYQVTDSNKIISTSDYVAHRLIAFAVLVIASITYSVIMGYSGQKLIVVLLLCLLKGLEALADVFYGILHKNDYLYKAGFSLTVKSLLSITAFFVIDLITHNIVLSISSMILIWGLMLFFYDIPSSYKIDKFDWNVRLKNIFFLFKDGFFVFLINFFSVYIVNAPKYAADGVLLNSSQAIFGIVLMPATLVSLAVQYLIQPYLKKMARYYEREEINNFNKIIMKFFFFTILFGAICLIGAYIFGIPMLSLVYGINLTEYRIQLEIIILGAIFYSLSIILSAAMTTARYTFIQFVIYLLTSIVGFGVSNFLISIFKLDGAVLAYILIMLNQFILYILSYIYLNKTKKIFAKHL